MAFQFCTNDFYLYAETEPADPGQTQVTNGPESGPSDSTEEAAEETPSSDTGTPEPSAPVEEQPAAPVEEQPAAPVEEQPEVASTLKVEFVDANNTSVKETVEQALTSKYVKDTINLDELGIDINVEGYTLTEVKDKNDNTQVYTTETKDFVLTGNVTELQFVYTQNVQTDQPENSQEPSTPQGGQEDQNSEEDQEDTDDEDSDSQTNEDENESEDSSKDDELAYPEQILSATASDGAIITIIAKEGALPEGAEVVVEPVESDSIAQIVEDALSQEGKELQTYKAYDIIILLDGEEIQPKVPIQVGITGSGITGTEKSLFHIEDGSSKADKISVIDSGNTQTFSAEGFSIYVVASSDSVNEGISTYGIESPEAEIHYANPGETVELEYNKHQEYTDWDILQGDEYAEITEKWLGRDGTWLGSNPTASVKVSENAPEDTTIVVVLYRDSWAGRENHYYYIKVGEKSSETAYNLYFYTLIPGVEEGSNGDLNQVWNGMGVGSISNVVDPEEYRNHSGAQINYQDATIIYPGGYPDIEKDGNIYHYAAPGTPEAGLEGYYTIQWFRVTASTGANVGGNGYNPEISSDIMTYHMDGRVELNDKDKASVGFMVRNPGSQTYQAIEGYYDFVDKGTLEQEINRPTLSPTETYEGKTYVLKSWYKDPACTQIADFSGTIQENTIYYASYVLEDASLEVDTPQNVDYDGTEHKWIPTVKNGGQELKDYEYQVEYSTQDFVSAND